MRKFFRWAVMCTTALFAACGGDGNTPNNAPWADDVVSASVANVTPSYTSATVKVNTVLAESIAYIVDQQADKGYDISQSKLKSYIDAGMEVSVFTLDNDSDWALISGHWKQLRGITTNYPKRMLEKTK